MPGPNPFDGFRFPDPEELPPLPAYQGTDINYGGYEEAYGGEQGNEPRLELIDDGLGGEGDLRAFRAYDINDTTVPGQWSCYITAGLVVENHILNQGYEDSCDLGSSGQYESSTKVIIPTINFVGIIDPQCDGNGVWTRPRLTLPSPPISVFVYCKFRTDNRGHIIPFDSSGSDLVTIVAFNEEKKSIHHLPPSPEDPDGLEGEYYILLNHICTDSANEVKVSHRFQSNILWQDSFVVNNESASGGGGGSRIYRRVNCLTGDQMLRRIYGCYALADNETDINIQLDWEAKNIGDNVYIDPVTGPLSIKGGGLAAVYAHSSGEIHSCGDYAKFRRITQGLTAQQQEVKVTQSGDIIRITGNSINGKLRWFKCDVSSGEFDSATAEWVIEWRDGLMLDAGTFDIKAGCDSANFPGGADGSFTWLDCDSASQFTITWVNGLIKTSGNHFLKAGCDSSGATSITTVTGGYGILATSTPTSVDLDFEAENVGTGLGEIYVDSAGVAVDDHPARFRRLDQTTENANPQIVPVKVGNTVEIRGNNVDRKIRWFKCDTDPMSDGTAEFVVVIRDGLVTSDPNDGGDGLTAYDIIADCDSAGDIKTITGGYAITSTVTGNDADLDFDAENVGTGTAEVYVDSAGVSVDTHPARFRRLAQTTENTSPQITPTKVGNTVEIRGNNVDGSLLWNTCNGTNYVTIQWKDGLIITGGNHTITAGCDSSGWVPPS